MFGMLDYRAYKLYLILFFIPLFLLTLFQLFGLPFIYYSIGANLAENRILEIIISIIALFIIELLWALFVFGVLNKIFQFIFELFVDVIPHDGRNKEEAQIVVYNGQKGIDAIQMGKHPTTWDEDLPERVSTQDWISAIFFSSKIRYRLERVRDEWTEYRPTDSEYNDFVLNKYLKENNLEKSWGEWAADPTIRKSIIAYGFLLFLFISKPF